MAEIMDDIKKAIIIWSANAIHHSQFRPFYYKNKVGVAGYGVSDEMITATDHVKECRRCAIFVLKNIPPENAICDFNCDDCSDEDSDHWMWQPNHHTVPECPIHGKPGYYESDDETADEKEVKANKATNSEDGN